VLQEIFNGADYTISVKKNNAGSSWKQKDKAERLRVDFYGGGCYKDPTTKYEHIQAKGIP
jgi:hypothetical protein